MANSVARLGDETVSNYEYFLRWLFITSVCKEDDQYDML